MKKADAEALFQPRRSLSDCTLGPYTLDLNAGRAIGSGLQANLGQPS
jgi:hypothetical protein